MQMHSINVESELLNLLTYEIKMEIDRELIAAVGTAAASNSNSGSSDYRELDGR
jgi:hypothetical protein